MSGRERDAIEAFFPSIDRNLMRDLDRHMRTAAPPEPAPVPSLASTSDILDAVDQAATAMAAMQARIHELESKQYALEATNAQLKAKLGELLQGQQAVEAMGRADRERATHAEQIAAEHQSRTETLEHDLAGALGDLQKIAAAIHGALGQVPER